MKTLAIAVALLFVGFCAQTDAATWSISTSSSVALESCAQWGADSKTSPEILTRDVYWMFGYITAMERMHPSKTFGGMPPEDFPNDVDAFCAAHPQSNLAEAAEAIGVAHKLIAPPPN